MLSLPKTDEKKHYIILLLGKTGAGKTTTINMLINIAYGNSYEKMQH